MVLIYGEHRRTNNNRMELMGPIKGIEALKQRCRVTLHSDSKYVVASKRAGPSDGGVTVGCATSGNRRSIPTCWEGFSNFARLTRSSFQWVRGHSGDVENERCDQLAVKAAHANDIEVDEGYETPERRRL